MMLDHLPDNLAPRMAHHSINCSTTDKEGVLRVAADLEIDGIATFASDVAVPTVGYVNDRLGLPGISGSAATVMTMKHHFRAFLKSAGLDHPNFFIGSCFEELEEGLKTLTFPVIVKPVDTSGSRGVTRVEALE